MKIMSRVTGLTAVLALLGACAQTPKTETIDVVDLARAPECAAFDPRQERADVAVVKTGAEALARGGYVGLRRHVPALEQVVARTPEDIETYRSCKLGAVLIGGLMAAAAGAKGGPQRVEIKDEPSPYPMAGFLTGAYYAETGEHARAAAVLEKAAAMAPADPLIAGEYAHALSRVGRHEDALTALDRVLRGDAELVARDRARLQRARGFALIELNRLDEAEAAYREALKHEPNHATALHQLAYIAQLRQGAPRREVQSVTSGTARTTPPN